MYKIFKKAIFWKVQGWCGSHLQKLEFQMPTPRWVHLR